MENRVIVRDYVLRDGERLSSQEELANDYPIWKNVSWWFNGRVVVLRSEKSYDKPYYRIKIFTDRYEYTIHVHGEYLGAYLSCRFQCPLEDWTRGNDLIDGELSEKGLMNVLCDILRNELVYIGTPEMENTDLYAVGEDDVFESNEVKINNEINGKEEQ